MFSVGGTRSTSAFAKATGGQSNASQPNLPVRSNAEPGFVLPGFGNPQDAAAALVSGELTVVAVPVEIGDVYTDIDVLVGATGASTPTHATAALYNAAGTLVAESADGTNTAISASGKLSFALSLPYLANQNDAPNGYLYAAVTITAGTVPSLISGTVATAAQYAAYTNSVPLYAGTIGSALAGTPPATITIGSVTKQAAVPVVFLR
jgi:hypothetical protein